MSTSAGSSGALLLAMTDLFISATATLLVVLTLASPDQPKPKPVQADLVMLCPHADSDKEDFALISAQSIDFQNNLGLVPSGTTFYNVSDNIELKKVIATIESPAKTILSIALAPSPDRPLTSSCFATATRQLLPNYHYKNNDPHEVAVPTIGLQVIDRSIRLNDVHE